MNELHSLQLSYYAEAVNKLFGEYPESVSVYSTVSAKLYPITLKKISPSTDKL